jgi:hypothetical protein
MEKKSAFTWFVLATLLLAALACSLPGNIDLQPAGPAASQPPGPLATTAPQTGTARSATLPPTAAQPPTPTVKPTLKVPNAVPLPLRQGLTSLNSYRLKIHVVNNGPTKDDKSDDTTLIEYNAKNNSTHTHTETISSSSDDPKPEKSVSDNYQIGSTSCQVTTSKSTPSAKVSQDDPLSKDLSNTMLNLIDFNLYTENPLFVAEENLNGVVVNHFTFKVTRLGKDSGMLVNQNSGEYWVAKDGQYLVKYSVILELASDKAGTKLMHSEISIDLSSINQPVEITMPANCVKK